MIEDKVKEEWKSYNKDYEVSSLGNVRSVDRIKVCKNGVKKNLKSKVLSLKGKSNGYPSVYIYNKKKSVHRMIAEVFLDNPNNYPTVNHKNAIKTDNRVDNLEWCTYSYNNQHAIDMGLRSHLNNSGKCKIVVDLNTGVFYNSLKELSELIGVDKNTLGARLRGQYKNNTSYIYA